jgi:hypothetical protein
VASTVLGICGELFSNAGRYVIRDPHQYRSVCNCETGLQLLDMSTVFHGRNEPRQSLCSAPFMAKTPGLSGRALGVQDKRHMKSTWAQSEFGECRAHLPEAIECHQASKTLIRCCRLYRTDFLEAYCPWVIRYESGCRRGCKCIAKGEGTPWHPV